MDVCGFILFMSLFGYYFSACAINIDEEEILCVYMKSCVLTCRFTPGSDLHIQWTKTEGGLTVHSFHHDPNQVLDQYLDYKGRTSLFEEEMNTGNASLQLRDVTVKDQGRFLCLANGQVTYVNMKVFAPVSEVHVYSSDGKLHCHAPHIYPKPSLKWTMNPEPSTEPQTSVYRSETGLFSVYSFVPRPPDPPYKYICTVSTEHSTKSTTYEKETERAFHYSPQFWMIIDLFLAFAIAAFAWLNYKRWRRRLEIHGFQVISSKFQAMWKKKTNAPREPRAGGETMDVPNPENEHLGPNNSEEAETELN